MFGSPNRTHSLQGTFALVHRAKPRWELRVFLAEVSQYQPLYEQFGATSFTRIINYWGKKLSNQSPPILSLMKNPLN
jgi:hypothetical protein